MKGGGSDASLQREGAVVASACGRMQRWRHVKGGRGGGAGARNPKERRCGWRAEGGGGS